MTITPDAQVTANGGTTPIVLTFDNVNWLVPQTITVAAVDDTLDEGDHSGLLTLMLVSDDTDYDALAVGPASIPIVDNDNANHVVVINEILYDPSPTYDANGDGTLSFSQDEFVEILNTSSQPVVIGDWVISDSSGTRYTFAPGTTLAAGQAIVVFGGGSVTDGLTNGLFGTSLAVVSGGLQLGNGGDSVSLFDGTRTIDTYTYVNGEGSDTSLARDTDLAIPIGAGPFLASNTFTAGNPRFVATPGRMNFDNEPFPIGASVAVVQSDGNTVVTEGGPTDSFTFALASAPSATVTVALTLSDGQISTSPSSLTFTTDNWETPQTVTVTAVNDTVEELATTSTISFALTSLDTNYDGLGVGAITVDVLDDDAVVTSTAAINEARYFGGNTAEFVELTGTPLSSFSGLTLLVISGEFAPGQLDAVIDLSTASTDENGFLLIADTAITAATDPGDLIFGGFNLFSGPQTLMVVSGYSGPAQGTDLDVDDDGILDSTPWTAILDSVSTEDDDGVDRSYSSLVVQSGAANPFRGIARDVDTTGTFVEVFDPANDTPGLSNTAVAPTVVTIEGTADGLEAGEVPGTFTVTQSVAASVDTVINYTVTGTAIAGTDFTALSGTVTILANETTATISVPVLDDSDMEPAETVVITLDTITAPATGVVVGGTGSASINIIDNDTPLPVLFINEIDADTPDTDVDEFVEIYDGGVGNTSLDGVILVLFNGSNDQSYATFDLIGQSTNANGFFVLGSASVPNVDFTPAGFDTNEIQNGADAAALYFAPASAFSNGSSPSQANLIDAIVYDTNDGDDTGLLTGLGQTVQYNESENGNNATESLSRSPDGTGAFVAQAPTPGATNGGIVVTPAPEVVSVTINQGATFADSRSQVTSVTIEFDSVLDATSLADAFTITNITTGQVVNTVVVTPVDGLTTTTVTLTFGDGGLSVVNRAGTGLLDNSLADGNYRLDVDATKVLVAGGSTTMELDFLFGGQTRTSPDNDDFFRLFGDVNGDGARNNTDISPIIATFNSPPNYRTDVDLDGNGVVNNTDIAALVATFSRPGRP